ncbi:MAG: T9SS type A sorting domain-containing protein [Lentimicrobium sp.]|uniref:FISUMP domain-containing protein n=1 Tax=Lentimicrobium sp. TaxID=2034841 RepID=UPI0025D48F8C|nr:FISUMP domain-containing protein [Lentimicrobium sp.]MCO5258122.1 T9SS type A sorting domain-containing protein [Lentimicrobium sp.]
MEKKSLLILMLLPAFSLFSQNCMISFSGSGETNVIDSVIVYNFQQNISLTLQGNDTLHLVENLGIGQPSRHKPINIYPNPTANSSRLEMFCYRAGKAVLQVYNTSGILIYQEGLLVQQGDNTFTLEGLRQGNYLIRINSPSEEYSGQLIAAGSGSGPVKLTKNSTVSFKSLPTDDKNAGSIIQMLYHSGERILLKSFAGPHVHIKSMIPVGNELVDFEFIPCVDGDGNYYPVTTIGTQVWMAENLKTTSYQNGDPIPNITEGPEWINLTTGGYCAYGNNNSAATDYGYLYNWFVVNDNRDVCPAGWHVPQDSQWIVLTDFLGGQSVAGGKLKETGTAHWESPNTGATNLYDFSAVGGGYRWHNSDAFSSINTIGYWWSATEGGTNATSTAWIRRMHDHNIAVDRINYDKRYGFSVRCLRN